ncbi:protein FAM83A [Centropristis striata]|uniref:protein FAM83A n=1 Tax=Centropristis striata TaxID=184440 RepID=UPI0027E1863F|nr:protein FAM83A [Centropristis striata]
MDASGVSVLWYRTSKPQGKVRRRVQDLRIPSLSGYDFISSRPALDLSHNESARLAVDSMLSQGLEGYQEVLNAEGEVDFLSDLEKLYIQENGRDNSTADPGASDDSDLELESLSAGSQSARRCSLLSSDSDPTVVGSDLSIQKDVKWTDAEPSIKVYFQTDGRAASIKDLVREFIRKAKMVLAIVMDSFSDVELLCDILEASRKRNVSVHLLLDHLNLNLFVSMWQDLKLDSKNFPTRRELFFLFSCFLELKTNKFHILNNRLLSCVFVQKLSVRSVDGQTYCAKTGRKLTGQIAENFIITDWKEVLTGSYRFSWLSWQVHRSFAVLVKGNTVIPFHQEFLRLYSSSKPVPGTRRQDHPQRHHQPSLQPHPTTEAAGSKSPAMAVHFKPPPQPQSKLCLQGTAVKLHLQPHTSQQARPPPRLNWTPQSRTERPRPLARHSSFDTTYGTGQRVDGQVGWRPLFRRSKSMMDRRSAGLNPNITKT